MLARPAFDGARALRHAILARAMSVWHVTVDGVPACTSPLLRADERLEPPICGSRNQQRAEEYADMLRGRHPGSAVEVVAYGCPMRGE